MTSDIENGLHGTIVDDPAAKASPGATIAFEPVLYPPTPVAGEHLIRNWQAFDGILLSMSIDVDETHHLHGSAVMVGPGVAFTAKHVPDPFWSRVLEGTIRVTCFGVTEACLLILGHAQHLYPFSSI